MSDASSRAGQSEAAPGNAEPEARTARRHASVFVDAPSSVRGWVLGRWPVQRGDVAALRWWGLTRLAVFALTGALAWSISPGLAMPKEFLDRWLRWDAVHFDTITLFGYDGDPSRTVVPFEAFFPGLPITLKPLYVAGLPGPLAQLLVSAVALAVAVVALRRLGDLERSHGVGERAVLLLLISPWAVFLTAGYSEALFLGFAIPAWLAAKRNYWWVAGVLGMCASATRVTGLFLALALVAQFVLYAERRRDRWPALLLPLVAPILYTVYHYNRTGDWKRWLTAQEEGWGRSFTLPWDAWATTWDAAFYGDYSTNFTIMWRVEILAAVLAVVVCVWLLVRRRWPEFVYVGGQTAALLTSSYYLSVPRAFLLWWPVWIGLAAWVKEHPRGWWPLVAVFVPINVVVTIAFSYQSWVG